MRAVQVTKLEGPTAVEVVEVDEPTPGPTESGAPSAASESTQTSTSTVGVWRPDTSAEAAATTVTPDPPFADQNRTNMVASQETWHC